MTPYNPEQLLLALKSELERSELLHYLTPDHIEITTDKEWETMPDFRDYHIRLSIPSSGFLVKRPKIGRYYRNIYSVIIGLFVKSSSGSTERLLSGNISVDKGLYEFFQDVSDTLEHNTLDGELDPYPGSSISDVSIIPTGEKLIEALSFTWFGNQDNIK